MGIFDWFLRPPPFELSEAPDIFVEKGRDIVRAARINELDTLDALFADVLPIEQGGAATYRQVKAIIAARRSALVEMYGADAMPIDQGDKFAKPKENWQTQARRERIAQLRELKLLQEWLAKPGTSRAIISQYIEQRKRELFREWTKVRR